MCVHMVGSRCAIQGRTTEEVHVQKASAILMAVIQALERALRTGTVLLTAAQADALWSVGCGDAIEDAKQAINRYTAIYIHQLHVITYHLQCTKLQAK